MPMYEYACDDCGYAFERVQSFHDDALTTCPECAGRVHRVISSVGIIFKGSGWYITDSKRQLPAAKTPSKDAAGEPAKATTDAVAPASETSPASQSDDATPDASKKAKAAADSAKTAPKAPA